MYPLVVLVRVVILQRRYECAHKIREEHGLMLVRAKISKLLSILKNKGR